MEKRALHLHRRHVSHMTNCKRKIVSGIWFVTSFCIKGLLVENQKGLLDERAAACFWGYKCNLRGSSDGRAWWADDTALGGLSGCVVWRHHHGCAVRVGCAAGRGLQPPASSPLPSPATRLCQPLSCSASSVTPTCTEPTRGLSTSWVHRAGTEADATLWSFTLRRNTWYLVYFVSVVNQTMDLA